MQARKTGCHRPLMLFGFERNEGRAGTALFLGLMGKSPRPEPSHRWPCPPAPSVLGASYELPVSNYTQHISLPRPAPDGGLFVFRVSSSFWPTRRTSNLPSRNWRAARSGRSKWDTLGRAHLAAPVESSKQPDRLRPRLRHWQWGNSFRQKGGVIVRTVHQVGKEGTARGTTRLTCPRDTCLAPRLTPASRHSPDLRRVFNVLSQKRDWPGPVALLPNRP
jgi:hypothetical protein